MEAVGLFVHAFFALFISLSFLDLGHSLRDLEYRVFAMWVSPLSGARRIFNAYTHLADSGLSCYPQSS